MSAVPFGFVGQCGSRGCGCGEEASPEFLAESAQVGDDGSIDALVGDAGVHAVAAGDQGTSATTAIEKSHATELLEPRGSGDRLPIDVAAPRCELDTEHSEGRIRQVRSNSFDQSAIYSRH